MKVKLPRSSGQTFKVIKSNFPGVTELRWAKAMDAGSDGRITRVLIELIKLWAVDKHPEFQTVRIQR